MHIARALRLLTIITVISLPPSLAAASGQARSSGWITPNELDHFSREMKKEHMMPTKVACKGDSRSTIIRDSMMINMTFVRNTEHRRWYWKWGRNFGRAKHNLLKHGWSLVSQSGFTRPKTGLYVPCGVFWGPDSQKR